MNNFTKVRLISKATLQTIKDNPRIILQAIFFFGLMLVPIIALWVWFISQSPIEEFTESVWAFLIIASIVWGGAISYYFEFSATRTLLKYWNHKAQKVNIFPKVMTYTGLSFGLNTLANLLPGVLGGVYGMTVPAITSLIPVAILDNPDKSIKQTLQDNKDMFSKTAGYAVFSQAYLTVASIGVLILYLATLFIIGFLVFYGLDVNTAIINTPGLDGNWIITFWNNYMIFAILSFMLSIVAVLFYRVLSSIIISTSLYVWYKNGNNPAEFQKVFLERALSAKKSEIFFT
jgi:preprotein translocase subunit Sec61beta